MLLLDRQTDRQIFYTTRQQSHIEAAPNVTSKEVQVLLHQFLRREKWNLLADLFQKKLAHGALIGVGMLIGMNMDMNFVFIR